MFDIDDVPDAMQPLFAFTTAYHTMTMAAGEVFLRRSMMFAHGSVSMNEAVSMVVEKATAFAESNTAASTALATGKDPVEVAHAALAPYGTRTAANIRDLRGFD
ncbi:MAG: hypothetical protein EA338_03440 [Roseinatronobacter sp.]|uniref:Uncharacterized protein n=1 Tax=Roseinatronobacter monicus TaxID=393481 RepID=A0A543KI16_9RHOB|nr:hypothetical protein [Roseinatronobacter monicus]TQM94704.1 hypothetical protein BD293_3390 [Roseinatronobacter monicus]TVQ02433.1 MAG: hypothetical protein EA338_03440 [Roseinatronobacter sp.]